MVNTSSQRAAKVNEEDLKKNVVVLNKIMSFNYLDKLIVNFKQAKIQWHFIVNNIEKGGFPPHSFICRELLFTLRFSY